MTECWCCGRATTRTAATEYVFGWVCHRAGCRRVEQALSDCDTMFWFRARPPEPNPVEPGGFPGRVGSYSREGERQAPRGMCEPSLQRKIDIDRGVGADA